MKRKGLLLLLALVLTLSGTACREEEPTEPPDLYGQWVQDSEADYYHIATIDEEGIRVYWYVPSDDSRQPYWIGTFTPPTTGKEPYKWESVNDIALAERFVRASREETKVFTYEKGEISYGIMIGRFKAIVHLRRVEDVESADAAQ